MTTEQNENIELAKIDAAEWSEFLEQTVTTLIEYIDPENMPAELSENPLIQKVADYLKAGDKEAARKAVKNSKYSDFKKMLNVVTKDMHENEALNASELYDIMKTFGFMNDKVNAELIRTAPDLQYMNGQIQALWTVNQAPEEKPPVPVYVSLTYFGDDQLSRKNSTPFDDAVISAIGTIGHFIQESGGNYPFFVTPEMIFRVMNGISDSRRTPSKKQIKRICDSMDLQRFTRRWQDCTEEINEYGYKLNDERIQKGIIDDNELYARKVTFKTKNHKEVNCYKILEEPIKYTYNRLKNHILYIPYALLDVSDTTSLDGYTIEIRNYLLHQIELMYSSKNHRKNHRNNTHINSQTLYKETGIKKPAERLTRSDYKDEKTYNAGIRKQRSNDRKKIEKILVSFQNKKYISGFSFKQSGKGFSVEIKLNPKVIELKKASPLIDLDKLKEEEEEEK